MKLSTGKTMITGILLVVLAVTTILIVSIRQSQRVRDTAMWVTHTEEILSYAQKLVLSVVDNETAARGYVLAGKNEFLAPLKKSQEDIFSQLTHLKKLTADNPLQQARVDSLRKHVRERIDFSNRIISLRKEKGVEAAGKMVATGEGKSYSDLIRMVAGQMEQTENILLQQRKEANERSISQMSTLLYSILAVVLILLIGIIQIIRNNISRSELRERKFSALLNSAPDATIIVNKDGIIQMVNNQTENIFGYKKDEVIGMPVELLMPEDPAGRHAPHSESFIKETGERGGGTELYALKKNGTKFPVEISRAPIQTEEGMLVSASVRDISERKKAEEKVRRIEERYHLMVDEVEDYSIVFLDTNGTIRNWNKGAEKIKGYKSEEIIGKNFSLFYTKEDLELKLPVKLIQEAIQKGKAIHEGWRIRKDGTRFWGSSVITSLHDENRNIVGFTKVTRDLTDRKNAEEKIKELNAGLEKRVLERTEELHKSEKKYRYLFENNPMPMWIIDLSTYKFLDVNEVAIMHYGYTREEFLAMTALDIRPEEEKELFKHADHSLHTRPANFNRGIWKHLKKDGTIIQAEVIAHDISFEGKAARFILSNDVTDRIKAEEKLKKSVKEISDYKYALDESSIVAITDQKGIIKHVNENFCKISKYNIDELVGQDHRIINSKHHSKEFIRNLWVTIANGKIWKGELKNKAKDGTYYWVDTTIIPFLNEQGKPYQYVAIRADITQRKLAEEKIESSEKRFRSLIENSNEVIIISDRNGKRLFVSEAINRMLGYTPEEFMQFNIFDAVPPEEAHSVRLVLQKIVDNPHQPFSIYFHIRHKNGSWRWIEAVLAGFFDVPDLNGIVINYRDVTERKEAEERMKTTLKEISDYKYALDESSIVAITDQKGIIRHVNDNFCTISKYSAAELIGQDHRIINSSHHPKEFIRDLWVTIANGKIWKGELKNKAKDGSFYWVDTTIVPFLDEKGKPYQYVAIRADITTRKKAEEELHKLNDELDDRVNLRTLQLEAINKEMEAFTYSVSHDLRAPLRGIVGFTQILQEDYTDKLDDEAKRVMSIITGNTLKMGHLIDDLLTFARTGRQNIAKTQIHTGMIVKEVIDDLQQQNADDNIEWIVQPLSDTNGDINMIRQVWVNLLSNAMKYSKNKKNQCIEIGSFSDNGQTVFFVKDNGVGFDKKYRDKLFKVFQRLHSAEEFEGTGVGLALVEKIISKHGGKVWADGEVNKGATFYFSVPNDL